MVRIVDGWNVKGVDFALGRSRSATRASSRLLLASSCWMVFVEVSYFNNEGFIGAVWGMHGGWGFDAGEVGDVVCCFAVVAVVRPMPQ